MTVAELIEILQEYPKDIIVAVDGYEGGIVDLAVNNIRSRRVLVDYNKDSDVYGPHEIFYGGIKYGEGFVVKQRLILGRGVGE